jgi:hypothetical protein
VRIPTKNRSTPSQKRSPQIRLDTLKRRKTDPKPVLRNSHGYKNDLNTITLSTSDSAREFEVRRMPKTPSLVRGVALRASNRWITKQKFPTSELMIPFINKVGKFTGTNLYRCTLQPAAYISTVIATVYRRLFFFATRPQLRNKISDWNKRQNLFAKCSAYYAISKNNYFWDRVLVLVRNINKNYGLISSILHSFVSKLDAHTWFVYGHVCLQTQWLTSRALRPRDKSALRDKYTFMSPNPYRIRDMGGMLKFEYDAIWYTLMRVSQM